MGNITNKTITKNSTCMNYYIEPLQKEYGYNIIPLDRYSDFINIDLDRSIAKYKDMYMILFKSSKDKEFDRFQREMLSVFGYQICNLDTKRENQFRPPALKYPYVYNEIKTSPYVLFLGFDNGNFCRLVSFVTLNIEKNRYKEKVVNVGKINTVCAMKPYSKALYDKISKINKKSSETEIEKNVLQMCKFQLGKILLFKSIQYLKEHNVEYITLDCEKNLLPYYIHHIGFRLGPSPEYDYTSRLISPRGYNYNILPKLVEEHDQLLETKFKKFVFGEHSLRLSDSYANEIEEDSLYRCFLSKDKFKQVLNMLENHLINHLEAIIHNALYDIFDKEYMSPSLSRSMVNFAGYDTMIDFRNGYATLKRDS